MRIGYSACLAVTAKGALLCLWLLDPASLVRSCCSICRSARYKGFPGSKMKIWKSRQRGKTFNSCISDVLKRASESITEAMWLFMQARLLLCHVTRRVSEGRILELGTECGFVSCPVPGGDHAQAAIAGPVRLLCFTVGDEQLSQAK